MLGCKCRSHLKDPGMCGLRNSLRQCSSRASLGLVDCERLEGWCRYRHRHALHALPRSCAANSRCGCSSASFAFHLLKLKKAASCANSELQVRSNTGQLPMGSLRKSASFGRLFRFLGPAPHGPGPIYLVAMVLYLLCSSGLFPSPGEAEASSGRFDLIQASKSRRSPSIRPARLSAST